MIDHITIFVKDLEKSKEFYLKCLAPLGMSIVLGGKEEHFYGFGKDAPAFEIAQADGDSPAHSGIHIAFKAENEDQIREFYRTALESGAKDNGPPGPRPEYEDTYYAAFVIDPDGNNIEACLY